MRLPSTSITVSCTLRVCRACAGRQPGHSAVHHAAALHHCSRPGRPSTVMHSIKRCLSCSLLLCCNHVPCLTCYFDCARPACLPPEVQGPVCSYGEPRCCNLCPVELQEGRTFCQKRWAHASAGPASARHPPPRGRQQMRAAAPARASAMQGRRALAPAAPSDPCGLLSTGLWRTILGADEYAWSRARKRARSVAMLLWRQWGGL